jgi:nucleoid-associated protein YgaU
MSDNWTRIITACAGLAVVWIVVYWWWQPSELRIRFDAERPVEMAEVEPDKVEPRRGQAARQTREPEPPPLAVIPPRFREYTVRAGDTLDGIARRELGSARHAEAISRANPLTNLEQIRPGRVILIPLDPENIQGRPVAGMREPEPVPGADGMVEYTVRAGDTLTLIARSHYGSIRYADLIYEANRHRLPSRDRLQVGQQLLLPPKPE